MPRRSQSHDRDEVACHLCFQDKALQQWIKQEGRKGGACPWCGRRGHLIPLQMLAEPFREVAAIYVPVEGPDAHERGESISFLLDDDWGVFSEKIQTGDLTQKLAVSILEADLSGKERYDYTDYEGFFEREGSSIEDDWDERAYAALAGNLPKSSREEAAKIEGEIADGLPDQITVAFEDLEATLDEGQVLYRARVHENRRLTTRFSKEDLRAPPVSKATAGRANREGAPVLYLASNRSTALAETRAWRGAAVAVAEVRIRRRLLLVDLSRAKPLESPFFVELLKWKVELAALLLRLGRDMSRPVMPHEEELLYRPTQLLAWLMKSSGYDGCIYPSAMGTGTNVVVFDAEDGEVTSVTYVRIKRLAHFSEPLSEYDDVYEEGPYDFALPDD